MPEFVLPVCSRAYLERHGMLATDGPVWSRVLLELTETVIGWRLLLVESGRWFEFSDYAAVLQTAIGGQGSALGSISAVTRLPADGTLVPASSLLLQTGNCFSLITPRNQTVRAIVHQIRDWMTDEMRREYAVLLPLVTAQSSERQEGPRACV